jgi:tetratricopeptide (TPR) repeat protein
VLLTLLRGVWRQRLSPSVAALSGACIGYSVWVAFNFDWAPATAAFWLLAGTAWSAVRAAQSVGGPDVAAAPAARLTALRPLAAVGLAAAVVWLGALPVLSDIWYFGGRPDLSVAADPLQGRYHWAYGSKLLASGSPSRGLSEMQLAARLGESDPQVYVDIGDAEQGLGRAAEAKAAYRMALKIDPFYKPARQRLAGKGVPASG